MPKMTMHEILTAINDVRKLTSLPNADRVETRQIDAKLLELQERLLDDYGDEPQSV